MNVIKRDGSVVAFDRNKIIVAVLKAFLDVDGEESKYANAKAKEIAAYIESFGHDMGIEEIQDKVVHKLMCGKRKDVAERYIQYRYKKQLLRETNTTDKSIIDLLNGVNEYLNTENSNKDAAVVTTQRDYLAGVTSTDITRRFLLPDDIVQAHDEGILHFHDADYFAQNALANCCLINLSDMLENGTVINGRKISRPHRLMTATTVATQIITAVASSQYGGCTISLTALAPFVADSYNYYYNLYVSRSIDPDTAKAWAEHDIKKEVADSVQTFNYQVNTMSTTNGQAPFVSVCMYLGETEEYKRELAMLIEEFLRQRITGMPNEQGVNVTQEFPKLLYVLEPCNVPYGNGEYEWLTKLASECTAKRMVPDYISEKMMKEYKVDQNGVGRCYPCINYNCA